MSLNRATDVTHWWQIELNMRHILTQHTLSLLQEGPQFVWSQK